jgi:hypothetical protein
MVLENEGLILHFNLFEKDLTLCDIFRCKKSLDA